MFFEKMLTMPNKISSLLFAAILVFTLGLSSGGKAYGQSNVIDAFHPSIVKAFHATQAIDERRDKGDHDQRIKDILQNIESGYYAQYRVSLDQPINHQLFCFSPTPNGSNCLHFTLSNGILSRDENLLLDWVEKIVIWVEAGFDLTEDEFLPGRSTYQVIKNLSEDSKNFGAYTEIFQALLRRYDINKQRTALANLLEDAQNILKVLPEGLSALFEKVFALIEAKVDMEVKSYNGNSAIELLEFIYNYDYDTRFYPFLERIESILRAISESENGRAASSTSEDEEYIEKRIASTSTYLNQTAINASTSTQIPSKAKKSSQRQGPKKSAKKREVLLFRAGSTSPGAAPVLLSRSL